MATALVVRGSGDPTFSVHFHADPLAPLDSLADSLALAGVRRVAGPLVVDQSRFDSVLVHPAWENFDLDWYYAAPVAPFALMEGAYPVVLRPGPLGGQAAAEILAPAGLFHADAAVTTVEGSRRWNDDLRRVAVDAQRPTHPFPVASRAGFKTRQTVCLRNVADGRLSMATL